ncbi:MAG: transglycosylase SLT domain-containing protein [Woeseiaceae bacterium]
MPLKQSVANTIRFGLAVAAMLYVVGAHSAEIDEQRTLFKRVYADVERGNWDIVRGLDAAEQASLRRYVLWPDLRATYLRATMKNASHTEIDEFLEEHGALKPARDLRYRYALHLAAAGDLDDYLRIYRQFYQGLDIAKLDCLALHAENEAGQAHRTTQRAIDLWLVGTSQVEECDPVFKHLQTNKLLGPGEYLKRYELAIDAKEFAMAQWLGRSISQAHVDVAGQWLQAQQDPENFARRHLNWKSDADTRKQLVYAIERITYRDPNLANDLWQKLNKLHAFSAEQEFLSQRHIALWTARDRLPNAYLRLIQLPVAAQNAEVMRWRARTSLRHQNWKQLLSDISQMSADERDTEEWQYWYNVALRRQSPPAVTSAALAKLAAERSYYGFLAADELGLDYALDDVEFHADEAIIDTLENRADLIRARELFLVGLDGRGRSEWDTAISYLTPQLKMQAAVLASRWKWHSRAISTMASAGIFDDLSLRYPLPYHSEFEQFAAIASIPSHWAYGVARSESLFMRDVRSSAGAIGLMQLMPATGKQVAQEIQLPYSGLDTLTNPQNNIQLGTTYLGQMAERYGGNRILATAAYNAGPHRVDRWLPQSGSQDARVWIENIPFNETRKYVRRVLAAETIFHWRMTGEIRRLSGEMSQVESARVLAAL